MPYRIEGNSNAPFVELRIEDSPFDKMEDAVEALRPLLGGAFAQVEWRARKGFSGDQSHLPDGTGKAPGIEHLFSALRDQAAAVRFLCLYNWNTRLSHSRKKMLEGIVPGVADRLAAKEVPGLQVIFISQNGSVADFCNSNKPVQFRVETVAAKPPEPAQKRLFDAIERPPPDVGAGGASDALPPWGWADDHGFSAMTDALDADQVDELVRNRLHLKPVKRLQNVIRELREAFVARDHALEMMVAAAIARVNLVFLGPPGTAKSLMVRGFSEAMGLRSVPVPLAEEDRLAKAMADGGGVNLEEGDHSYWEYLLTRHTTPDELFGGVDINVLLKSGVHRRLTRGMLPQAEVAFLDEIFKANSAILNTLLTMINERIFYNMGRPFKIKLTFVVGASNETPEEANLGALYDRFPLRVPCLPVAESDLEEMLAKSLHFDHARMSGQGGRHRIPRLSCLNDVRLLSKVVQCSAYGGCEPFGGWVDGKAKELFLALLMESRRSHGVSDRTAQPMLRLARALALLEPEGPAEKIEPRHLRGFGYICQDVMEMAAWQTHVQERIRRLDDFQGSMFDRCH